MSHTRKALTAIALLALLVTLVQVAGHPGGPPSNEGWTRSLEDCGDDYGFHADRPDQHGHDLVSLYTREATVQGQPVIAFFLTMSKANPASLVDYDRRETISFTVDGTEYSTVIQTSNDESFTITAGTVASTLRVRVPNAYHIEGGGRADDGPDSGRVGVELGYTYAQLGASSGSTISGWRVTGEVRDGGWIAADVMPNDCPSDDVRFVSSGYTVAPAPPQVSLTASTTDVRVNQVVDFSATVTPGAGSPHAPTWTFGDGATAAGSTVSHTFGQAGTYTVTTTVTDDLGSSASATATIDVKPAAPVAKFTFSPSDPTVGQTITFTDQSTVPQPPATRQWEFGDGSTSTETNPSHTYASAGLKTVKLTLTDGSGQTATRISFVQVREVGSAPPSDTTPPTATFSIGTTAPRPGQEVSFTDTSTDNTGVVAWAWDFGDGQTSTSQNPKHAFANAGTYTVNLTVADAAGLQATATKTVKVAQQSSPAGSNAKPQALFIAEPTLTEVGEPIRFTDQSTDDRGIASWSWTFGDGEASQARNPSHTYTEPGSYRVRLVVTDTDGETAVFFVPVRVVEATAPAAEAEEPEKESPGAGLVPLVLLLAGVAMRRKQ